jgi:hypothetical protein
MAICRNKEELTRAVRDKAPEIIVEGKLAKYVHWITKKSDIPPNLLCLTGGEIFLAIVAIMSIVLVIAIAKGYEEVEFDAGPPPKIKIRRRQA